MCTCPAKEHPVDALNHVSAKVAFLGDAFAQGGDEPFSFSETGQFGFLLILRGLEDEVKAISDQLFEAEEVRS